MTKTLNDKSWRDHVAAQRAESKRIIDEAYARTYGAKTADRDSDSNG